MTDLIAELAEVVQIDRDKRLMSSEGEGRSADGLLHLFQTKAADFLRTHHAEIEAMARDAVRWRSFGWAEAPMVTVTGSQLARGIRPGDFTVPWDWPVTSKTRVRLIAMHDSAREGGNE